MSGPRIYWDAHNYLSMGLCVGPPPDSDEYFEDDPEDERCQKLEQELKDKDVETGFCIDWYEDPEDFARSLEEAAAWLRKVAAARLTENMFHIRTDID